MTGLGWLLAANGLLACAAPRAACGIWFRVTSPTHDCRHVVRYRVGGAVALAATLVLLR